MNELISWLRTQLDTDEQTARLASGVVEMFVAPRQNGKTVVSAFMRINTPERALRQVQAHRAILDRYEEIRAEALHWLSVGDEDAAPVATEYAYEQVMRVLVSIYSDRDGYKEEWSA